MLTRRRILAAAAVLAALPGTVAARVRGVYDLAGRAFISGPVWFVCEQPTVRRDGAVAVVEARCRTERGAKIPRRGASVTMDASVEYADTEEDIGDCTARAKVRKAGAVTLACEVALPQEPALPVEITGTGPGLSEPFWLPGGSLLFETTATPDPDTYNSIRIDFSNGDSYGLWDTEGPGTVLEVNYVWELLQARITSYVEGPWRVVISEAFPS